MMKNLPNLVLFGTQNPDIICSLANSNFAALLLLHYLVKIEELILALYKVHMI